MSLELPSRRVVLGGLASMLLIRPVLTAPAHAVRVEAARQSGGVLLLEPLSEPLFCGDIVTIAGVLYYQAWIMREADRPDRLREFVVTREVKKGGRLLHLYPPIIPAWPENPKEDQYATVQALPAHGAEVRRMERPESWGMGV